MKVFQRVSDRAIGLGVPVTPAHVAILSRLLDEERERDAATPVQAGAGEDARAGQGSDATDHARVLHGDGAVTR